MAQPNLPAEVLPGAEPDGERILTWRQIYDLPRLPDHLVVIGSGVTGAEFASAYTEMGVDVTLVSSRDRVLPHEDADAAAGRLEGVDSVAQFADCELVIEAAPERLDQRYRGGLARERGLQQAATRGERGDLGLHDVVVARLARAIAVQHLLLGLRRGLGGDGRSQ